MKLSENPTLNEIRLYVKEREHWKKGTAWWYEHLIDKLPKIDKAKIGKALDILNGSNEADYDEYDSKENHDNENKNQTNKRRGTALEDQTLEEYCESIGLDPDKIDKYNDVKYWTDAGGNRRYSIVPKSLEQEEFKEDLIEAIKAYTPQQIPTPSDKDYNSCAGLINIYDAHFDKLSQIGEGYTIEDNIALVRTAFSKLLKEMRMYSPEIIYLPIGNDLFDTNDFRSTTKKGTPQALSVHWKESFQMGVSLIGDLIMEALNYTEKVVVIPIEGNHDEDKVFYLNEVIKAMFAKTDRVQTEDSSAPRFYYMYGENMLGFGHGSSEKRMINKLSSIVPMEQPILWGKTTHREMFLGDIHHKEEYKFTRTVDKEGLTVRFLRDIGLTHSTWDRQNAYHVGKKTVEAHIFDIEQGLKANLFFNI